MALRRPPRIVPRGRNETMLREYRLLAAWPTPTSPTPGPWPVCDDPDRHGGLLLSDGVRRRLVPHPGGHGLARRPSTPTSRPAGAWPSSWSTASPSCPRWTGRSRGLEGFGKPDGFHERQVDRWMSHLAAVQFRDLPGLDAAAAWLRPTSPATTSPGSCTATTSSPTSCSATAPRPGWPPSSTGRWRRSATPCSISDGSSRVGPTTTTDARHRELRRLHAACPRRRSCSTTTRARAGAPVDEIDYYVILARFKLAVVLEGGYARVVQGRGRQSEDGGVRRRRARPGPAGGRPGRRPPR